MALDTSKPFTRRRALAGRLTADEIEGPRFRRIFHGVYIRADIKVTTEVRAQAVMLIAKDGGYVSHHTAARLWGGWAPLSTDTHISTPGTESRTERRGIRAHRSEPGLVPVVRNGIPLAPPTRVFLQLAAEGLSLVDLVAVGDSLVAKGRVTQQELIDTGATYGGAGCRRARRAAGLVRDGVDSVMETRLRLLMVLARLPEPGVNRILRAHDGSWEYRIDLSYVGILLAVEYEGRQHAESARQWNSDIRRRTELEAMGWRILLVTAEGIYQHPERTVRDIKNALRDRGVRTTTRRPSVEWYREFVGEGAAA